MEIDIPFSGKSMEPLLKEGDTLKVRVYKDVREVSAMTKAGDVVCFKSGDVLIIHRIIGTATFSNEKVFIQRGEQRGFPFPSIMKPEYIIGKVISARRPGGVLIHEEDLSMKIKALDILHVGLIRIYLRILARLPDRFILTFKGLAGRLKNHL